MSVLARRTLQGLKSALSTRNGDRLDHSGPVGRFALECSFLRKCSRVCFSHSCSHTTTDGREREREREDVKKGSATSTGGELCGLRSRIQVQTDRQKREEEENGCKWVFSGFLQWGPLAGLRRRVGLQNQIPLNRKKFKKGEKEEEEEKKKRSNRPEMRSSRRMGRMI